MPFSKSDAKTHKKGLTEPQQERWAAVANDILTRCMSRGGNEETCAGSAIRQANGVVGHMLSMINSNSTEYAVRQETHQNRNYIVVPVTMMVEGVHSGSLGPLFHSIDELGKFPDAWNGIPVVINHPQDQEGNFISANSPGVIDTVAVGKVFNTHVDGDKLRAEAWLDIENLAQVSPLTYEKIQNTQMIEVSVGVFTDQEPQEGTWNNESFIAIAHNHRPDHLALLPVDVGACSISDGCGIGANNDKKKKGETKCMDNESILTEKTSRVESIISANYDQGYRALVDSARRKIDAMDNEMAVHYLQDVFDNYIVYEVRGRQSGSTKFFKQPYTMGANGEIELTGNAQQVVQKVSYESVPVTQRTKFNQNKNKEVKMDANCGQCMEKVIAIINSNKNKFTANDREWLIQQEETVLDKLMSVENAAPQVNSEVPQVTNEQILQALSKEDREALAFGKNQLKERKANMIKTIQANTSKETWPDDVLESMEPALLERVFNSLHREEAPVDYSLNGVYSNRLQSFSANTEAAMFPLGVEISEK